MKFTRTTLTEIRRRAEVATGGPWRACTWDPMERPHVHKDTPTQTHCGPLGDLPLSPADAEFIAHARTDIPLLLEALERTQHELRRAADMLAAVAGDIEDGHSFGDTRGKYVSALVSLRDDARAALPSDPDDGATPK